MTEPRPIRVPTREGLELTADLYLPEEQGPWPVLLHRTPYGSMWFAEPAQQLAGDLAVVVQNCRGRFGSDGTYDLGLADGPDGFDTIEWIARQSWCDGRVAGYGYSYSGYTQLRAAAAAPPSLVSIAPLLAGAWWKGFFFRDPGGPINLATAAHWLPRQASTDPTCKEEFRDRILSRAFEFTDVMVDGKMSLESALSHRALGRLPLREPWGFEGCELFAGIWRGIFEEPPPLSYFDDPGPPSGETIRHPTLILNGWYDIGAQGSIETFRHISSASPHHRLIMAPIGHGETLAEVDAGDEVWRFGFDVDRRWAREWIFEDSSRLRNLDPVTYFTIGAGEWRSAKLWPPPGVEALRLFFYPEGSRRGGRLSTKPPRDEVSIGYVYDPRRPVPTRGGMSLGLPAGPCDQSGITGEARPDMISFTGPPLERDLEITGAVEVELFASSDAPDTDFTAKLLDVSPQGKAMSICDGIVRARYRSGPEPHFLLPGKPDRFRIHLESVSYLVPGRHRLRVDISSSNFPRFDRNANTGAPEGSEGPDDLRIALQTIYASRALPSAVILPVMR